MYPALAFFTLLLLLVTILPLLQHSHWVIRGMDFPRLQFAVVAALLLIAHVCFLDGAMPAPQILIALTILCLIWQLWWILPYTPLWRKEVEDSRNDISANQLCVLTSNVLKQNRDSKGLIDLVEEYRPDVLVTLESDLWWERELEALEINMPFSVKCPLDNLYGMHVYSRLPLFDQEICYLVEEDVPSIHATIEMRSGDNVRMHFLHPAPPSPTENTESAERDAELAVVARSIAGNNGPVIVTGDLNDVAWSSTTLLFRKVSGLLDPRIGRGFFNTFHADYWIARWPLDHLYHSHHFVLRDIRRLPPIGSDHFPLLTRLSFSPSRGIMQKGPTANAADEKRAIELSDEQSVSKDDVPNAD